MLRKYKLNTDDNRKTISRYHVPGIMVGIAAVLTSVAPTIVFAALVSAVLPTSRSTEVGNTVTAFAAVINRGPGIATGCSISPVTPVSATFLYQTTDLATNALTGTPNTPVDIATGAFQAFLFAFTPSAPFAPTEVQLSFDCTNTNPAASISGLNTFLLSASSTPVPDIIALVNYSGTLDLSESGAFAVATVNVGATGTVTASADTGSATLPVTLRVCETSPSIGFCINPTLPAATATTTIAGGETSTFAIFATSTGPIVLDPANNRVFVTFTDSGGNVRGQTSTAVASNIAALVSAVLPTSRSTEVGSTATAFATVINTGPGTATGCSISPVTPVSATFLYQTTDPATNALTGIPNTPVDIAEGAAQTFLLAFTPSAPFAPTEVKLSFDCTNTRAAAIVSGLNTLLLSTSPISLP